MWRFEGKGCEISEGVFRKHTPLNNGARGGVEGHTAVVTAMPTMPTTAVVPRAKGVARIGIMERFGGGCT